MATPGAPKHAIHSIVMKFIPTLKVIGTIKFTPITIIQPRITLFKIITQISFPKANNSNIPQKPIHNKIIG